MAHKRGKKRSFLRSVWSAINPKIKQATFHKSDFEDWPFTVDQVQVECRRTYCLVVIIEGYEYALNGMADAVLGLPDVFSSGCVKVNEDLVFASPMVEAGIQSDFHYQSIGPVLSRAIDTFRLPWSVR